MSDARPACLVTNVVSHYREGPFALLCEAEDVEVIAWAHRGPAPPGMRLRTPTQLGAARLAGSGRYRAVIGGMSGRVALPGAYLGARRAGVPFVLWATIWAHPRTPAHALSWLPLRRLYRHADAVATYGPHVSDYVAERRGRADDVFVATQAVSPDRFARAVGDDERLAARARAGANGDAPLFLFVGRLEREKGLETLLEAWRRAGVAGEGALAVAGDGPLGARVAGPGVTALGRVEQDDLPALYAAADALVVPSIATRTFREPWGLVANEAMHQGTPVVASDAVGAVAGGLIRDGRNGLVFPGGDAGVLATRLRTLALNPDLRAALGGAARDDVAPYTPEAWVGGMSQALAAVGRSRA
ncbi:MAG TPA: glycosyltransferase family 4 protein [Thermoleophilaceae bacterium]|nr:glycosyltransferase family 4 protein [Thermoleophilaceae bacterium]